MVFVAFKTKITTRLVVECLGECGDCFEKVGQSVDFDLLRTDQGVFGPGAKHLVGIVVVEDCINLLAFGLTKPLLKCVDQREICSCGAVTNW